LFIGGTGGRQAGIGFSLISAMTAALPAMVASLALELAPIRVNAIHPGIVGDSPYWHGKPPAVLEGHRSKTITGKLATMADIVDATRFLLENPSVEGVDLAVDNGRMMF
jgi:NAD(P)-dependent dehydrogenase (short-subunit alcohol dehydrogenase family)